ncbi:hypothetical protein [Zhihengliuella salsuginis]|uniref:Transcriptional regulator, AbiEi antitoxin, Type IV TA system n=1 Tax=Zhihengliuella salsuginis TaxID=578222 RepID=A0ABQ3GAL1_9MICC|nr:hypothetical protein [Zhihengliuella salsuginis]GHC99832.1 hypothetical protein GCM10008096_02410 [Zhihengliuella salsuginis]
MRRPEPLPAPIRNAVFTGRQAAALGVAPDRLRAGDLRRVGAGLYAHGDVVVADLALAAALRYLDPRSWMSHLSAATHHGLWLPPSGDDGLLHISRFPGSVRRRARGIASHEGMPLDGEVEFVRPVPGAPTGVDGTVSTRPRAWLELATTLDEDSLVAIGDQLVRRPDERGGRRAPYATITVLAEMLARHPHMNGVARARRALELVRVGSDSRPESLLRLALVRAGLPEPELQISLDPRDFAAPSADLGYRERKIVLQYEGAQHRTPAQFARDIHRDQRFQDAGWTSYKYSAEDLQTGFGRAVHEMRAALRVPPTNRRPGNDADPSRE